MGKLILNGKEYLGDGVKDVKVNGASVVTDRVAEVTAVEDNPTFTEASTRANIVSGESFATILGKIKKFFTDLKAVAFSGSYNDLSDKPTIPDISTKVSKSGDTMTGTLKIDQKNGTAGAVGYSALELGNNIPQGTAQNSCGVERFYGKDSYYTDLYAPILTANRTLNLPDKNGTVALTSDIPDISTKVSKSGDTMTGNLIIQGTQSSTKSLTLVTEYSGGMSLGGNAIIPQTTDANGVYQNTLPNKSGTLALTNVDTTTATAQSGITFSTNIIKKENGVVTIHLYTDSNENTISCASWGGISIATIPVGYRPSNNIIFPLLINNKTDGKWININVRIHSSGVIRIDDNMVGTGFVPRTAMINASWII